MQAAQALYDVVKVVVSQRRAEGASGDDLISRLINAEYQGRSLDDHEIATFVRSLLPAASETTTRTFGTLMSLLLQNPDVLERVRNDRSLVNKAIDEAVRFEPVATFKVRQAAKDLEIRGVAIPKGAMVQCIVTSANRDEDAFENADTFDIDRKAQTFVRLRLWPTHVYWSIRGQNRNQLRTECDPRPDAQHPSRPRQTRTADRRRTAARSALFARAVGLMGVCTRFNMNTFKKCV